MKNQLRNIQTFFPWVRPLKFGFYNLLTRYLGAKIDPDLQILVRLPKAARVLDIGGNWGQSIYAIRRLRPEAKIVSFEPNPSLSARLARAFAGDGKVEVRNLALSSKAGELNLFVPAYRGFVYDGLASLDKAEAQNWLNPQTLANFDPAKLSIQSHTVPVSTLDETGLDADFIKIDVQGHELEVLKGGERILSNAPTIMLEAADAKIAAYLAKFALKPFGLVDGRLVEGLLSNNNTIFMTDATAASTGFTVVREPDAVQS